MSAFADIISVRLGEYAVTRGEGRLATLGLGSCVALILHDADARVGGVAHVVLPSGEDSGNQSNPVRFADTAVPFLVDEMVRAGASAVRLRARLVGGASMFATLIPAGAVTMGQRNVERCREALSEHSIPIVAEEVGETFGRSAVLDVSNGTVTVRAVGQGEHRV